MHTASCSLPPPSTYGGRLTPRVWGGGAALCLIPLSPSPPGLPYLPLPPSNLNCFFKSLPTSRRLARPLGWKNQFRIVRHPLRRRPWPTARFTHKSLFCVSRHESHWLSDTFPTSIGWLTYLVKQGEDHIVNIFHTLWCLFLDENFCALGLAKFIISLMSVLLLGLLTEACEGRQSLGLLGCRLILK